MIYRFNRLAIFPGIVSIEILPIPVLMMIDDSGKHISFEFLVLGRVGIIKNPLLEWDIFTDKIPKQDILLIKVLDYLK